MQVSTMNSLSGLPGNANANIKAKRKKTISVPCKHLLFSVLMMIFGTVITMGQATLPHLDPINYTVGQDLQNQTGWTSLNTGTDGLLIATGNLSYAGLPVSTGNKISFDGAGLDGAKLITQQTSGTVYYSFLVNVTALGSLNTTGGYFTSFNEGTGTNFGATVWTRKDVNGTGYDFGINARTTVAQTVWGTAQTVAGTHLIVVSYQMIAAAGNDVVKMWIDPAVGGSEPAATLTMTNTGGTDLANINRILIRQDAVAATPFVEMDELRVGTTWASVAPAGSVPVVTAASPTGTVGVSFTYNIVATNSPTSYALSSGSFPPGLTLTTGPGAGAGTISGTPTTAGPFTANVTATNGNGTSSPAALSFTIALGSQTITGFPTTDTRTYTAAVQQYNLSATGGASGNAVTFSSDNPAVASIVGTQVTINAAGSANITASQAGNANYNAATPVVQVLTVNKATQTISFGALIDRNDVDPNFPLTATGGGSGNPVTYTSSLTSVCQIVDNLGNIDPNGSYVDIIAPGQTTITASQAGNSNYLAATSVQQTQNILNTSLQPQVITFGPLSNLTYGDAASLLTATGGGSGNPIVYSSSVPAVAIISDVNGNADVNGQYVKVIAPGTTSITANQAGNGSYNAASPVSQSLTVNQKTITITGATAQSKPYDGTNAATITGGTLQVLEPGDVVTFSGGGTFPSVNAGTYTVTGAFVLGGAQQAKYILTQPTFPNISITQLSQTISFAALPAKTYGNADYTLTATGGASGNPVTFSSPDPFVTITGNSVHINGAGTAVITASQAGNTNYSAATDVPQSQLINKASQTITFVQPLNKTTADAPFATGGSSTSLLTVSYSTSDPSVATVSGSTITIAGRGIVTITASQPGDANYLAATSVARTFAVTSPLIAAWDFTGAGNLTTSAANIFHADLNSSNLITRGAGAASSAGANSFRTVLFKNDGISTSNTDYFQTTLSAGPGKQVSLSDIAGKYNGTNTFFATPGVTSQFAYSLDGTNFTLIGSPVTSTSLTITPIDLTGIPALQNVYNGTTITIRYYASGQTATGGWGFFSSVAGDYGLTFGGTVVTGGCSGTPPSSTISGPAAVCSGSATASPLSLSVVYDAGTTYQWASSTVQGGPYTTTLGTSATQATGALTQATYYICTITCSNGGASFTTAEKEILVNPLPTVNFSGLGANVCIEDGAVTITSNQSSGTFSITGATALSLTDNGNGTASFNPVTAGIGGPYTITYTYTNGNGCTNSSSQQVSVINCTVTLNMKLFLQGYYAGGQTMQPVLNNQLVENSLPTETDSITVELHDESTVFVDSKVAVLHTDGMVSVTFNQLAGNYFVAIKHRNSIQTWSSNTLACTVSTPLYDFTTSASQALADNQIEIEPGVWAIFSGDLNQDDYVDGSDYPLFDADAYNGVNSVYVATDLNGDGYVDGSDYPLFDVNSYNGVSSIHP